MSCASFGKETLRRVSFVATAAPAGPVTATPVVTPILCDFLRLLCKTGDVLRLLPLLAATAATAVPAALFGRTATTAAVKEVDPGATTDGATEEELWEPAASA